MKMTNKTNLPPFIVEVADRLYNSHRDPNSNEFSTTELLKGTKELLLLRRHHNEIENDVQDSVSLWTGSAVHEQLQKVAESFGLSCEKELARVDTTTGCFITGRYDFLDKENGILYDLKDCKVAGFQKAQKGEDEKWHKQLCSYISMLADSGIQIKKAIIIAIITDHSKIKAGIDPNYPQGAIQTIEWDMTSKEELEYITQVICEQHEKIKEILSCADKSDDEIPPCTDEERFCDTKWAVYDYLKGKKELKARATKLFDTEEEANQFAFNSKEPCAVVFRKGESIKCKHYCSCKDFCNFYRENVKGENNETVEG